MKHKVKIAIKVPVLCLIIFFLIQRGLIANDTNTIDSNIIKINKYIELLNLSFDYDSDSSLFLSRKVLNLSTKSNYEEGILKGYYYLAKIHNAKHNLDSSRFYYEAGIKRSTNNYNLMTQFLWEYASLLWISGNYAAALENNLKIKEIIESGKTNLYKFQIYNSLGRCYESLLEYDLAIENFNRSLQLAIDENDEAYTGLILTNLGSIYYNLNDYTKSLDFLKKGVDLEEKNELYFNASFSHNSIAEIYLSLNLMDSAKLYIEKAYHLSVLSGDKIPLATTLLSYGKYYYKLNDIEKSKDYATELIKIASEINYKDLIKEGNWLLSEIYSNLGNYKSAYESFKTFFTLHSEIYNIQEINKVKALEQKLIQRELEKELVKFELKKQKTINSLLIIVFFLALGVGVIILIYLFQFKKLNKELIISKKKAEESDQLKSKFLQTISHEIRTPLNGIVAFSEMIVNKTLPDSELIQINNIIHKNSDDLISTIENLVDIAHLSTRQFIVKRSNVELLPLLDSIVDKAKENIVFKKNTELEIQLFKSSEISVFTDKNMITKILQHLLKNAILYTEKGLISIGYEEENSNLVFFVSDTGIGIPKEKIDIIFSPFRQADEDINIKMGGTGLGLSIVNEFIELLGGKIWVDSELQKGSTFSFSIPK